MSLTNALVALIRSHPARATPLAPELLALEVPEDLRTLVDAWVHHGRPSQNSLAAWSVFDVWDFQLAIEPLAEPKLRAVCATLAGSLARTSVPDGPYLQLGFDGGGHTIFAGVRDGKTATFGPEDGEDYGDVDGLLFHLQERADFAEEPALTPFLAD